MGEQDVDRVLAEALGQVLHHLGNPLRVLAELLAAGEERLEVPYLALADPGERGDDGRLGPAAAGDFDNPALFGQDGLAAHVDVDEVEDAGEGVETARMVVVAGDDDGRDAGADQLPAEN